MAVIERHPLDWYPDDPDDLGAEQFDALEELIERGQQTFVEVGVALQFIRARGLAELRRRGYRTFEEYCERRWGWSRQRGLQLMQAASVVEDLKMTTSVVILPATEAQARPLVSLKAADDRRAVWSEAVRIAPDGRPVTADLERLARQVKDERRAERPARVAEPKAEPIFDVPARLEVADALRMPIEDESVDLIVTSPPYGLDIAYDGIDDIATAWPSFMGEWLTDGLRVSRDGGRLALNVPLDTTRGGKRPTYAEAVTEAQAAGWTYQWTVVWAEGNVNKSVARGSVDSPSAPHVIAPVEMIAVFSKGDWARASDVRPDIAHEDWLTWTNGLWMFSGEGRAWESHPAPFPEELPKRLIQLLSFPGDTVLDPFVGSGTTALVALRLGREAIGFDQSAQYIESARRRIAAEFAV